MTTKTGIPITRVGMLKLTRSINRCANQEQLEICKNWLGRIFDTEDMEYGWLYSLYLQKKSVFIEQENKVFKRPMENLLL